MADVERFVSGMMSGFGMEEENRTFVFENAEKLTAVFDLLQECGFDFMADITCVEKPENFVAVYQVTSFDSPEIFQLRVILDKEKPSVASAANLWRTADWLEREAYDMFGVVFEGHPNLKRILMWEGYKGHPLRKDFVPGGGH